MTVKETLQKILADLPDSATWMRYSTGSISSKLSRRATSRLTVVMVSRKLKLKSGWQNG